MSGPPEPPRTRPVLVFDTNVLVGWVLPAETADRQAVTQALAVADLVASPLTMAELDTVIRRPHFDRYLAAEPRVQRATVLAARLRTVAAPGTVGGCADPDDDMFLDLAVAAGAEALVTADRLLLTLNPFRGVTILTPRAWLRRQGLVPVRHGPGRP